MFKKCLILAALTASLFAFSAMPAAANTIYYALTVDKCSGGCAVGPHLFGAIKLEDISGGVALTVLLADGSLIVETGQPAGPGENASVAFNLKGNPTLTANGPQLSLLNLGVAGSWQFPSFGDFEYGLHCILCGNGGGGGKPSPISVDLFGTGLDVSDFAEKSLSGDPNVYFAVDIYSGLTGKTGWVGAPSEFVTVNPLTSSVPDGGSTMTLLGSAFLGLGMLRRRFGKG